jgi:plasmid stabilization system protein ParE
VNVRFLTVAQQEVDDAFNWFAERTERAGLEFLDDLDRAVRLVRGHPLAFPEIEVEVRRCLFARFPYSLVYGVEGDFIIVIAVAHSHREPLYWIERFKPG